MTSLTVSTSVPPEPPIGDLEGFVSLIDSTMAEVCSASQWWEVRVGFKDVAGIISDYVACPEVFGAEEWKKYFQVDVGPEVSVPKELIKFWNGPDPKDVFDGIPNPRRVSETHLRPVLGWESYTDQNQVVHERSLDALEQVELQYQYNSDALKQNRHKKIGRVCWLVMRRDVEVRGESWPNQQQFIKDLNHKTGAGYEEKPSAIDLGTVILPYKKAYNERHLGDNTGAEKQWTYSRCIEVVKYGDQEYPLVFGGSAPSGVRVFFNGFGDVKDGVGLLRKF